MSASARRIFDLYAKDRGLAPQTSDQDPGKISVTELRVGHHIVINPHGRDITVASISLCPGNTRGVPAIHVNDKYCYSTIGTVIVR
jgi:hypothetical protein